MKRYLLKLNDKASKNREVNFVEMGLYDYWSLAMRIIGNKIPPTVIITKIEDAFTILQHFIVECGNTINIDLPDGYNTDHVFGVEIEDDTMRLIWYSIDKAYLGLKDKEEDNAFIEINQNIFGENLEQQYGFTFDKMLVTPSYILMYAKKREIPQEIETDKELLKKELHPKLTVYEHHWGDFKHEPILQFRTRYYCDEGLCAVIYPKAIFNAIRPDDFFED